MFTASNKKWLLFLAMGLILFALKNETFFYIIDW